jgi:hypothetical protein
MRPWKFNISAFVTAPHSRRTDEFGCLLAWNVSHLFDADNGRQTVSPGLNVRRSR